MKMTLMKPICLAFIHVYRLILSPLKPPTCRYRPSCSEYALQVIRDHGVLRGLWYAVRRLLRCHPWAGGWEYDPPPPQRDDHGRDDLASRPRQR